MRKTTKYAITGVIAAAACTAALPVFASSHREAPAITEAPKVDGTDFYMFRSYEPGREAFVTFIANYQPLQAPYGGPNYFTLDPDAIYEIHIDNDGDAVEDITFQFDFATTLANIALDIDGTLFVDTTNIAYEIERRVPSPPVIPSDARERALCHAIEEWADESLYFVGLYYQWFEPEGAKRVPQAFGKSLYGRAAYLFFRRKVLKQIEGQGTSRKPPEHVRADLERHLDALEGLVQPGPFMFGDTPRLCDCAVLGQMVYLGRTPVGGEALAARARIQTYLDRFKALRAKS